MLAPSLAVARSAPPGLNATDAGEMPVANGEPATGVSAPPAPTENTDTVSPFPVARSAPDGLNATDAGVMPVVNGEPGTWVSAPAAPTENTDTVPS